VSALKLQYKSITLNIQKIINSCKVIMLLNLVK
jgi:hypothetical protein